MFDKYVLREGSVRNVSESGQVVGFAFDTRIAYYRGLGVSMVEPFEVRVDGGEPFPPEQLRFTIGDRTWTIEQMEADDQSRWEMTDVATVTVLTAGGLTPGRHTVEVTEVLRVSYLPVPSRTQCTRELEVPA